MTLIQVRSWKTSNFEFSSAVRTEPYHQLLSEEQLRTAVNVNVRVYWGTKWLAVFFHKNGATKYIRWRIAFDSWLEDRKKCIRGREVCLSGDKLPVDKLRGKWNSRTESKASVIRTFDVKYIYGFVWWGVCKQSRWRHSVTEPSEDSGYVLLWQRYDNNKMMAMRYYGNVSFCCWRCVYWACYRCILHLQQYSHRLNLFLFLHNQPDALIIQIYSVINLYMFRTFLCLSSGVFYCIFGTGKFHAGLWWPLPSRVRMELPLALLGSGYQ